MKLEYSLKHYLNLTTHTAMGIDLVNWTGLLWRNKFDIDIRYLPKALFLTANVVLNTPLQLYEYFRYKEKIQKTKVEQPLFILGHYRSGTTYLHYVLSKDPNFAYCNTYEGITPHIFLTGGDLSRKILDAAMPETRPQDNVKAGATLPIEEEFAMGSIGEVSWVHGLYFPKNIFEVFDRDVIFKHGTAVRCWQEKFLFLARKLSYKYPGKRLLLKSPANTARVKEILSLFPDAQFIHIYRNPYKVFLSTEGLYEKILPLLGFHRIDPGFMREYIFYAYEEMYKKYLEERELIPEGQLYELSYENFIASPMEHLEKIYRHLRLGPFEEISPMLLRELKESETYSPNTYTAMDDVTRKKINERWKFVFDEFGYGRVF